MTSIRDRLRGVFATDDQDERSSETGQKDADSPGAPIRDNDVGSGNAEASTPPPASQPTGVPFRPGDPRWPDVWGHRSYDSPGGARAWVEAFFS
jgi:hypothetical protein